MLIEKLLPDVEGLNLDSWDLEEEALVLEVSSQHSTSSCPGCGNPSDRVHSRYQRQPADLPLMGTVVRWVLTVRRFFCKNPECECRIFTERLPVVLAPYARRTHRLATQQQALAFSLGGEEAARQMFLLGMPTSPDTALRLIRKALEPEVETPRVLGVDDWAKCKGQDYGTILVDLEKHCPVDLLPERSAEAFATWLKAHPGVEIISRDRGNEYIKGATEGAPQAIQVADRWHLLKNLRESLEAMLATKPACLKAAAHPCEPEAPVVSDAPSRISAPLGPIDGTASSPQDGEEIQDVDREPGASVVLAGEGNPQEAEPVPKVDIEPPPAPRTQAEVQKQARQAQRQERYETVHQLRGQGASMAEIAQSLKLDRATVRRYLQAESCPQYPERPPQPSKLDPFKAWIRQRWQDGCHRATQILEEIRAQGYRGGKSILMDWIASHLRSKPASSTELEGTLAPDSSGPERTKPAKAWSARRAAWVLMKVPEKLSLDESRALAQMQQADPEIEAAYDLSQNFAKMLRERTPEALSPWLEAATESGVEALKRYAKGLRQDGEAVKNAVTLKWSNGQTEGQVNRLKLLKRQMYGRANFDLLRKRVLAHPLRC